MSSASNEARIDRARGEDMNVALSDDGSVAFVSGDNENVYKVTLDGRDSECECPDHEYRGTTCKHLMAAADAAGVVCL